MPPALRDAPDPVVVVGAVLLYRYFYGTPQPKAGSSSVAQTAAAAFLPGTKDTRTVLLLAGTWYFTTNPEAFIIVNIPTGQRHILWRDGGRAADKLATPGAVPPAFDPPLELQQDNGWAEVDRNWYWFVDGNVVGIVHNTSKVRHLFSPRRLRSVRRIGAAALAEQRRLHV